MVVVHYRGSPEPVFVGTDLFELGWTTDGRDVFVASEPAGAATWFPANDHPTDKATFRFEITVPPGFPEKYREALIRVAEQCAVKKHLEKPPRFEIATIAAD